MANQHTHRLIVSQKNGKVFGNCKCGVNIPKCDSDAELRELHEYHKRQASAAAKKVEA